MSGTRGQQWRAGGPAIASTADGATRAPKPGDRQGASQTSWRRVRRAAGMAAPWAGLTHICLLLGGSVAMQVVGADDYGVPGGVWLQSAPESWLHVSALSGAVVGVLALLSGRLWWPALAFGGLFTLWISSGAVSSWALTGQVDMRSVYLGVACGGLALGAAAARPAWSGWALYLIGAIYIWLNLFALYKNYYSLGIEFTVAGRWWLGIDAPWPQYVAKVREIPAGLPYPGGHWERVISLPRFLWDSNAWGGVVPWGSNDASYQFRGLTGNGNRGGNFVAPLIAFAVPFARQLLRTHRDGHRRAVTVGSAAIGLVVVAPGLFLLFAMGARAAFVAAIFGVGVGLLPLGRFAGWRVASAMAVAAPLTVLLPWLLVSLGGPSLSGRDCLWDSWVSSIRGWGFLWGIGPPGTFPAQCSSPEASISLAAHAHNELLQAWSVGGLVGFVAASSALALLGWFAASHRRWDYGALAATLATAAILMGVEVMSSTFGNHVHLGIGAFGAVSGRSLALMSRRGTRSPDS